MATITSRDFNRDVSAAKRAAATEPVIITDRGVPAHVLISFDHYRRLSAEVRTIVDWLSVEDASELPIEKMNLALSIPDL